MQCLVCGAVIIIQQGKVMQVSFLSLHPLKLLFARHGVGDDLKWPQTPIIPKAFPMITLLITTFPPAGLVELLEYGQISIVFPSS